VFVAVREVPLAQPAAGPDTDDGEGVPCTPVDAALEGALRYMRRELAEIGTLYNKKSV
jgi:hypothetical protein